jgi:hypothetical protein
VTGAYFQDRTGTCVCLVPGCDWRHQIDPNQGLGPEESVEVAHTLLGHHRETAHPYLQLQVQKCPLRGCAWQDSDWSTPGVPYRQSTRRLQKNWSKHMTHAHPTVRGPGTIQVGIRLFPYDTPSQDGREIASGALHALPDSGVPIVSERGEIVGRVSELREEDGWAVAEGFLREDLVSQQEAATLWSGKPLPVSFAVNPDPHTIQGDRPFYIRAADLRNVRVSDTDVTVWEGTGMTALHPETDTGQNPPAKGETRTVAPTLEDAAVKAAMMSLETALRPLRDAMEEWSRLMAPAVLAASQALAEYAKAAMVQPEPMHIVPGPGFAERIQAMSETVLTPRDWRYYVGQPPVPEGPEDWPRLPRDGKRAPTGCDVCEAPLDGRHPAGCPGA